MRVFLALTLPLETARVLARKRSDIEDSLFKDAMVWVPPANYHMTIKYFGEQSREFQYAVRDIIVPMARSLSPIKLELDRLGCFPTGSNTPENVVPRVLWAGLKDSERNTKSRSSVENTDEELELLTIHNIAQRVEVACEKIGCEPAKMPFHPHVTLARCKEAATDSILALLSDLRASNLGHAFVASELTLYESRLRGEGAEYRALWRLPLGDGAAKRS